MLHPVYRKYALITETFTFKTKHANLDALQCCTRVVRVDSINAML